MNAPTAHLRQQTELSPPENETGEHVTEVVAMYAGRVVDVRHLEAANPKTKRRARFMVGMSATLILGGLSLFAFEVAQPWAAYNAAAVEAVELAAVAPNKPGLGTGGLGLGLALLGLVPGIVGLGRLRREDEDEYSIGESPAATMQVSGAGLPDAGRFTLVSHADSHSRVHVLPTMPAELRGDERWCDAERSDGPVELRDGTGAVLERGGVRFYVRRVPREQAQIASGEVDKAFWGHVGGVGAFAAAMFMMMTMVPDDMMGFSIDEDDSNNRFARYLYQADAEDDRKDVEPEPEPEPSAEAGGQGSRAPGSEGEMGDPTKKRKSGHYKLKRRADTLPQLARNFSATAEAKTAGILGVMAQSSSSPLATPFGGAFAVGADDEDIWGGLDGDEFAASYGGAGLGLVGTNRGGGGLASGILGLGSQGLIGHGVGGGTGTDRGRGPGNGHGAAFDDRRSKVPVTHIGKGRLDAGSIDKSVVRRIVRSHINEVRSCYNQGLVRNPNLLGRVSIQFVILGTGKVSTATVSENSLKDAKVGRCVAAAVKRWRFPKPRAGGTAIVNYPFSFSAA